MVHHLKDKYLKEMAERHPEDLINLLHPESKYQILSTKLEKELIIKKREADKVIKIRVGRRVYLLHLEFISHYRRKLVRKAYGYGGALSLKYDCEVATILFILKPPSRQAENLGYYEVSPFGQTVNQYSFAVVKLWELREAILAGQKEYLGFVPLLPEISRHVDKKLLKRQRELIDSVDDPVRQAELLTYTVAFNEPYFGRKFLQNYFMEYKKMLEHWEQVPLVGDFIKEKVEVSEKKGETRGKILNLRENILDVLNSRFGHVNGNIARRVQTIDDPQKLRAVFRRALTAKSLDTVKDALAPKKPVAKKKAA